MRHQPLPVAFSVRSDEIERKRSTHRFLRERTEVLLHVEQIDRRLRIGRRGADLHMASLRQFAVGLRDRFPGPPQGVGRQILIPNCYLPKRQP